MKRISLTLIGLVIISFMGLSIVTMAAKYDETVYQAQKRLKELGYNPGPLDGLWGKLTKTAIKKFQQDRGLTITGKINEETLHELNLKESPDKQPTNKPEQKDKKDSPPPNQRQSPSPTPTNTPKRDTHAVEPLSPIHGQQVKRITELSLDELDVFNSICAQVLKDYFGESILAWFEATFNYLPTSDEGAFPDFGSTKLDKPITLISVSLASITFDSQYYADGGFAIKNDLKRRISTVVGHYIGKEYGVVESLVLTTRVGDYASITIVPLIVFIK